MKRVHQILSVSAAIGAGLLTVSAFAQQPAAPPSPPQTSQSTPQADAAPSRGLSNEDRIAFFEARMAAVRAGLRLTADQERLWPPVEAAVRDMSRQMSEMRDQRQAEATPADPLERMARMGDAASKRGAAMTRIAEAARPLYATLSEDQKRRLHILMRAGGYMDGQRGMMGAQGEGYRGHHAHDQMRGEGRGYGHHGHHGGGGGGHHPQHQDRYERHR